MTTTSLRLALFFLLNSSVLFAQNCQSFDWHDNFIALTRIGDLWMPNYGDGDNMTEPLWEEGGVGHPYGSPGFHESWYIARDPSTPGTAPFYRLLSQTFKDHMDTPDPPPYSYDYQQQLTLGYPWTSAGAGMAPLTRYFKSSIFDHVTWLWNQPPSGYSLDAIFDSNSPRPRYGYQRFGNFLDINSVLANGYIDPPLSNNTLRIEFNKIWGNGIGRITYLPSGKQLVDEGIGDMVQAVVWGGDGTYNPTYNPTEAGGTDVANYSKTERWAGSPVLSDSRSGSPPSQVTELRPFNFNHDPDQGSSPWQGTDPYSPLMWRGTFRKTTTLGYTLEGGVLPNVIRLGFQAKLDANAPPCMQHQNPFDMNHSSWLKLSNFGDGNQNNLHIELLNAAGGWPPENLGFPPGGFNNDIKICLSSPNNQCAFNESPAGKAVVISKLDYSLSVGIYSATQLGEYAVTYWCGTHPSGGTCPPNLQDIVVDTFHFQTLGTSYQQYPNTEDAYMVVGSRDQVIQGIRQVYCSLNGGQNCSSTTILTTEIPTIITPATGYEVANRFSSSQNGYITALRFYKVSGETGPHTLRLWSDTGTLLGLVTTSNESPSGWQEQPLSPAVMITANVNYRVSYTEHVQSGKTMYVFSNGSAISNPPLAANKGYYGATGGAFPTTASDSNMFVDVRFHP